MEPELALAELLRKLRGSLSQVALASELRVSNKTVSQYERAIFGPKGPSKLTLLKWCHATGGSAQQVMELAGVSYSAIEESEAAARMGGAFARSMGAPLGAANNSLTELRTSPVPVVRAALVDESGYSDFDRRHLSLVVSLIDASWGIRYYRCRSYEEAVDAVLDPAGCHVGVGLLDTIERAAAGLAVVPYPGLRTGLAAVRIGVSLGGPHTWSQLLAAPSDVLCVSIRGEAGDNFLRAVAGYSEFAGNLITVESYESDELEQAVLDASSSAGSSRSVVFCGIEDRCARLVANGRVDWRWLRDGEPPEVQAPWFSSGVGTANSDASWREVLRKAQSFAFDYAPHLMAEFYRPILALRNEAGRLQHSGVFHVASDHRMKGFAGRLSDRSVM